MEHQNGFTVAELLILVAIVAIIWLIVISVSSRINHFNRKAEIRQLVPDLNIVVDDELLVKVDKIKAMTVVRDKKAIELALGAREIQIQKKVSDQHEEISDDEAIKMALAKDLNERNKKAEVITTVAEIADEDPAPKTKANEPEKSNPTVEKAPPVTTPVAAPGVGFIPIPATAQAPPSVAAPVKPELAKAEPAEAEATPLPPADTQVPEMDAATPEPVKIIIGVILSKAQAHYSEGDKIIEEYWFYVRKFDNSKIDLLFDGNAPVWLRVDQKIFQTKEVAQTYDSRWKPEPEKAPEPKKESEIHNS